MANKLFDIFYGDRPMHSYMEELCAAKSFMLIDYFQFDKEETIDYEESVTPTINTFIRQIPNCTYTHLTNGTSEMLLPSLPVVEQYLHFRTFQLVFDFSNLKLNLQLMHILLKAFRDIFDYCKPCLPFLALFTGSMDDLYKWTLPFAPNEGNSMAMRRLDLIMVSHFNRPFQTLHLHPVINGCLHFQGIYWPKSENDYQRLKVHFTKCDLGSMVVNVSVNHVSFLMSSAEPNKIIKKYVYSLCHIVISRGTRTVN